jgi:hypothetical protein
MNTLTWGYVASPAVTSWVITKSTDGGSTFSALATVAFSVTGANFNPQTQQFFYADAAGNPGDIYEVVAVGSAGTSLPVMLIAPPAAPQLCKVIGYLKDPFGGVDQNTVINVNSMGTKGERWVPSTAGLLSQAPMGLAVTPSHRRVYPDANGMWQVSLVYGAYCRVEIPSIDFSWTFEVPAKAGPINIRDLPQLRGEALGLFQQEDGERMGWPNS